MSSLLVKGRLPDPLHDLLAFIDSGASTSRAPLGSCGPPEGVLVTVRPRPFRRRKGSRSNTLGSRQSPGASGPCLAYQSPAHPQGPQAPLSSRSTAPGESRPSTAPSQRGIQSGVTSGRPELNLSRPLRHGNSPSARLLAELPAQGTGWKLGVMHVHVVLAGSLLDRLDEVGVDPRNAPARRAARGR